MPPRRPLLLGHRGARATRSIPENTLASFDLCLEHGCDGFEFDVRRTADSEAVVCHDATIAGVRLAETRSADLGDLQAKGLVPALETVLRRYAGRCFLDIELKDPGLEGKVADFLRRWPPQHGYVVSSFLPEVIVAMHRAAPEIPRGLITDKSGEQLLSTHLPADYLIPHWKLVDPELAREIYAAGKKMLVWTVNGTDEITRLKALGVEGIISDQTERLVHAFRQ
jgi:glycerophosphoryl diester phosphodiesterase